jgi:hypothetical protein
MSTQANQSELNVKPTTAVILCQLPSGQCVTTSPANCINTLGGMVVDVITIPTFPPDFLVLYTMPSGNEVVGTYDDCLADGGVLVEGFDSRVKTPSDSESSELFICKLPSGNGTVGTFDQCQLDGGTVIGKITGRTQQIPA